MAGRREPSPRWTDQDRREILRQLDASALGVKEFARRAGVCWSTLYEWRRKLARDTGSGVVSGSDRGEAEFAEVRVVPDQGAAVAHETIARQGRIEIAHPSGWSVFVEDGFDDSELARVLDAVASRC